MTATTTRAKLWTPAEVAEFLDVSLSQLAYLRRKRTGPAYTRIGREVRYVPRTVEQWVIDNQTKESSAPND